MPGVRALLMASCAVAACGDLRPLASAQFAAAEAKAQRLEAEVAAAGEAEAKEMLKLFARTTEGEESAPGMASAYLADRFRASRSAVRLAHQLTR